MIPRVLHRVVPTETPIESEQWWAQFVELHPGWEFRTHRDPLNAADWPLTSRVWRRCTSGAQFAGLVRLEALARFGGVYVDQDVEPYRSFEPLLHLPAFAAWEDRTTIPDAVLGAEPGHPAIRYCLRLAIDRVRSRQGPWASGPGVTTTVLADRSDVLVLPPGAFYPYHYNDKGRRDDDHRSEQPWCFAAHHWFASWLPAAERSAP